MGTNEQNNRILCVYGIETERDGFLCVRVCVCIYTYSILSIRFERRLTLIRL